MSKLESPQTKYVAAGMAAMLPGMQYALDLLQGLVDEMRGQLAGMQAGLPVKPARGRPPKAAAQGRNGWPASPAARKREMARRMAKRASRATHPRQVGHPDHEQWLAQMRRAQARHWRGLTAAQRKARTDAMLAGRKPSAKLERSAA